MPNFKNGDWVIGNAGARRYGITCPGWVGMVVSSSRSSNVIRVVSTPGDSSGFEVNEDCFDPLYPPEGSVRYPLAVGDVVVPSEEMEAKSPNTFKWLQLISEDIQMVVDKMHTTGTVDVFLIDPANGNKLRSGTYTFPHQFLALYKDDMEGFAPGEVFTELFGTTIQVIR